MLNLVVSYLPCVDVFYSLLLASIIAIHFFFQVRDKKDEKAPLWHSLTSPVVQQRYLLFVLIVSFPRKGR
jgi:hypothetical protein